MMDAIPMTRPQYITAADGTRVAVILPLAKYERLIERLEDEADAAYAQDYATRKAAGDLASDESEVIPWEQVKAEY